MADLEIDDQVREVVDDMLADRWSPGASHAEKAEKWQVSISVVWRRASEASRFIRMALTESAEDIRDELLRNIRRIGGKAEGAGEYRDALGAQELRLRVHGLLERKPPADDGSESVPVEQLAAALRALGHEVKLNERPVSTPAGSAGRADDEGDTERPEKQRVEGLLESDEE